MIAASLFRQGSERHAERPALAIGDEWLSHAGLADRADRIAGGLRELGVHPGDRVVLALPNSPDLLMIELALLRNGLVRVALGGRARWSEIVSIASDCQARAIVVEDLAGYRENGADTGPDTEDPATPPNRPPSDRVVWPNGVLLSVLPDPDAAASLGELAERGTPPAVTMPAADQLAMLMYSSGSTGEPKAAVVTQHGWASCMLGLAAHLPAPNNEDVVIQSAPMSHFGGSVGLMYAAHGAGTVVLPRFDPEPVLRALDTYGGTALPLAPTMLRRLTATLRERDPDQRPTGTLRAVPYGGSAISAAELGRAVDIFGASLVQFYGLAEALTPITVLDGPRHLRARRTTDPSGDSASGTGAELASAGAPAADTEVRITGPDGAALPAAEVGEIRVRGPRVLPAYWRRPDSTAAVLRDGWFATGDLGYLRDGLLYLVDRSKDVIVSGGYNVYPSEVERVIAQLPGVRDVAVVAVPDQRWGEGVGAVVVPAEPARPTAQDVIRICRQRLGGHKKPVRVEFVTTLPTNGAGKVDKKALRDRFWQSYDRRVGG